MVGYWSAVRAVEVESACSLRGNRERAVVQQVVVPPTEQHEVGEVGAAAADPVCDVMCLEAVFAAASRMTTAAIAEHQGLQLSFGDDPVRSSEVEHGELPSCVARCDCGADPSTAQQPFDDRTRQARAFNDATDRSRAFA
jgi:hypothetical protein